MDCSGQSYDNASNMSGKYSGLKVQFKDLNEFVDYIPCFAHSLNLFGKCATECCQKVFIFFEFFESIYTFFSASTYQSGLLSAALSIGGAHLPILKRISNTRWSAGTDTTKALLHSFSTIKHLG